MRGIGVTRWNFNQSRQLRQHDIMDRGALRHLAVISLKLTRQLQLQSVCTTRQADGSGIKRGVVLNHHAVRGDFEVSFQQPRRVRPGWPPFPAGQRVFAASNLHDLDKFLS